MAPRITRAMQARLWSNDIKPWTDEEAQPPYTVEELTLFAFAMYDHDGPDVPCMPPGFRNAGNRHLSRPNLQREQPGLRFLSEQDVYTWICTMFPYYNAISLDFAQCIRPRTPEGPHYGPPPARGQRPNPSSRASADPPAVQLNIDLVKGISRVFDFFHSPVFYHPPTSLQDFRQSRMYNRKYSVEVIDLQYILRQKMWENSGPGISAQATAFRLMELPVEVRLRIFGLVLDLPRSGVAAIKFKDRTSTYGTTVERYRLHAFTATATKHGYVDYMRNPFSYSTDQEGNAEPRPGTGMKIVDPRRHLAILAVNREIYREAMPVFFSENKFIFETSRELLHFLIDTSPARAHEIRKISFALTDYSPSGRISSTLTLLLANLKHLQHLEVWISERELSAVANRRHLASVVDMPCVKLLRQLRGLRKVIIRGDAPFLKPILEAELILPKN